MIFVSAAMNLAGPVEAHRGEPLQHIELPNEEPPPFHGYTSSEQAALLAAAAPGDGDPTGCRKGRSEGSPYVSIALDLATGMLRGELLGLRVSDIDLAHSRLHVRQAPRRKRDIACEIGPCTTKRSRRPVALPKSVITLLAEHATKRPKTRSNVFFLSPPASRSA